MATHSPTDLVGTAEICRQLQVSPSTVTRWVHANKLHPAQRLGARNTGPMLFTRAEVARFIAERTAREAARAKKAEASA